MSFRGCCCLFASRVAAGTSSSFFVRNVDGRFVVHARVGMMSRARIFLQNQCCCSLKLGSIAATNCTHRVRDAYLYSTARQEQKRREKVDTLRGALALSFVLVFLRRVSEGVSIGQVVVKCACSLWSDRALVG